jgi:quercetin dioxygenase-like cupin family protein
MSKTDYFHLFANRPAHELMPGFIARIVHTDEMTIVLWDIKEGSVLPRHQHIHEQITHVLEGTFEMQIGHQHSICKAGSLATIPSDVPHEGKAVTDCKLLDIFRPVRVDFPTD